MSNVNTPQPCVPGEVGSGSSSTSSSNNPNPLDTNTNYQHQQQAPGVGVPNNGPCPVEQVPLNNNNLRGDLTLPKTSIAGKIKENLLKLLHLHKSLHDAKVTIETDGHRIIVKIETEASKIKDYIDKLFHHKHLSKAAYDATTQVHTLYFKVPDEYDQDVRHLLNDHVAVDQRIAIIESRLKDLGFEDEDDLEKDKEKEKETEEEDNNNNKSKK